VTYQTAFVDKNGKLQLRNDIYGRDKALLAILKSDERKIADTPIERKDNTVRQEALAVPDVGRNIFAQLFGFTTAQRGPAPRQHAPGDKRSPRQMLFCEQALSQVSIG
jgi:hypothetical protein